MMLMLTVRKLHIAERVRIAAVVLLVRIRELHGRVSWLLGHSDAANRRGGK
jgi:hypothetical protein